jgi:hypothetical protein
MPTKTATKKAAPAKASKRSAPVEDDEDEDEPKRGRGVQVDMKVANRIKKLKDAGKTWDEISEETEIGVGKAMLWNLFARVDDDDRIPTTGSDEQIGKRIVKAREGGYSWGAIMARTGMGEARLRTLFELSSGESASGNRIGKGGRYPGDVNPNGDDEDEDEKPARKAKPAAQGKPVPAAVSGSSSVLTATLKQLQARLDGKTIQIIREEGGKPEKIKVKNVSKRTKDGELHFSDMAGKSRVIMLEHLKGVSK